MKYKHIQKLFTTATLILTTAISFSQAVKKDTLKTEEISVVKPYIPKIADAFKVKSNPTLKNTVSLKKKNINYRIFSIPVASTFTPSKGKVQKLKTQPQQRLFNNYILAGFGNYKTPLFETFIKIPQKRNRYFGVFAKHHSSENSNKTSSLSNAFYNTHINSFYKVFDHHYTWQINGGIAREKINYYGIPTRITTFSKAFLDGFDEKQVYNSTYISGKINLKNSFLKESTAKLFLFSDHYNSHEVRFLAKPTFELPISTEIINGKVAVDMVIGKFKQNYNNTNAITYRFLNLKFNPNLVVLRDKFTLNLGANISYSNDLENKISKFYAYPNITTSYKAIENVFTIVAGVTGELQQNTYQNFVKENPYVSPTLNIQQTDKQYAAFIGGKGKLSSKIGFDFSIKHTSEKNKALYIQNPLQKTTYKAYYELGNSFSVVYDDLKTWRLNAELNIDVSKNLNVSSRLHYFNYQTNKQDEAWNLPRFKMEISSNYQYKKWEANAQLFYRGSTKDYAFYSYGLISYGESIENAGYVDLNFSGAYHFSSRFSAFAKINNLLNKNYQNFANYQVQGLQILAGVRYQFDL